MTSYIIKSKLKKQLEYPLKPERLEAILLILNSQFQFLTLQH